MEKVGFDIQVGNAIKEILEEYYEDELLESNEPEIQTVIKNDIFSLKDLKLGDDDETEENFIVFVKTTNKNRIQEEMKKYFTTYTDGEYIIYILVSSVEEKYEIKKEIKNLLPNGIQYSKGEFKFIHIPTNKTQRFDIHINSCFSRVQYDYGENKKKKEGLIYTAKLIDLIKIYNELGNKIFAKNVRYKIEDTFNVEEKMQETLESAPENFWFFNNGIAMLVAEDVFNENKEKSFKLDWKNKGDSIQIINGAQTVSTAADFYYEQKYKIRKFEAELEKETKDLIKREEIQGKIKECEKIISNIEESFVVLRLIFDNSNDISFQNNVSIALNRQKPIRNTDIRYQSPEVKIINDLYIDNNKDSPYFHIAKNGEDSNKKACCNLITFAKIYSIYYLQLPGKARNGKGSLITEQQWKKFEKDKEESNETYFSKRFKPFLQIQSLFFMITNCFSTKETKTDNDDERGIFKYTKEYLTAYISYILNGKIEEDFSNWTYNNNDINNEKLSSVCDKWAEKVKIILKDNSKKIDSNVFKGEKNYLLIRNKLSKDDDFNNLIIQIFSTEQSEEKNNQEAV